MHVPEPNIYADLEAAVLWEQSFADVDLSGNWAEDLLAIAKSQLGYTESDENFDYILNAEGTGYVILGWTRYGAWYGYPYGDWCAMFVSFCLHYAGIPEEIFPYECENVAWVDRLRQLGRFAAAEDYTPKPGDLIFFDRERDQRADHVGIVSEVDEAGNILCTIEGNHTKSVNYFTYALDDRSIMGYGILPGNPRPVVKELVTKTEADPNPVNAVDVGAADEAAVETGESGTTEPQELPAAPIVLMPPQEFQHSAGGIAVSVSAPEGAFPEGSWMYVTPVNGNLIRDLVSQAVCGKVLEVQAVDIKFYDTESRVIDPQIPIRVTITPAASQYEDQGACVVHIDDTGKAGLNLLAETSEIQKRELVFDTDCFSIYAVVYVADETPILS